jgi:hypothetical protein
VAALSNIPNLTQLCQNLVFFFFFGKKKCYFNEPYHKENVKYREKSESKIHDNPEEDYVTFVA